VTGPALLGFRGTERFEVVRQLGAGAFGVVYEAYDRERRVPVALKTLGRLEPAALYRFKQEFRGLADVHHRNLAQLHELVSAGDLWFFTMELVRGVSFFEWVRPENAAIAGEETWRGGDPGSGDSGEWGPGLHPPLDIARLRPALRQLAEGVAALHEAGRLHRDLKPTNVLVTPEGRVVILDFGLATELETLAPMASAADLQICGTAGYMSPEQAAGQSVGLGPACDWYAVGAMLYEALAGRLPFLGSFIQIITDKQRYDPPSPRALATAAPPDLDALCMDLLRRAPEERPAGAAVLARLGGGGGAGGGAPAGDEPGSARLAFSSVVSSAGVLPAVQAPLVGRSRHLAALAAAFATARRGSGVTLFIHGPAGTGKSALARCFADELARRDQAVVLVGRCYERESVPFKALDTLVDSLSRYLRKLARLEAEALLPRDILALARVFPVLRRVDAIASSPRLGRDAPDPQETRRRAFAALRELLARLADRHPLVLLVDDLQWGDVDSAAALADLLRPPEPPPLLLIGAYRSEDAETSPCVRALRRPAAHSGIEGDVREVAVGPLAEDEAQAVARALLSAGVRQPPGEPFPASLERVAARIARESAGNPLFVEELVRFVQGEGHASGDDLVSLDEALRARFARLGGEEPRRLLEVVAVAGRPVERAVALGAADVQAGGAAAALAVLRTARLVRTAKIRSGGDDAFETYHNRIREAVVSGLGAEALAALHGRLAAALEATGKADPEALEVHYRGAGDRQRAGKCAELAAARAAEALAFDRAVELYRRALELEPEARPGEPGLGSRRTRLADALANAGRGVEAAEAYLAARDGAPAADALELERRAAEQFLRSGRIDEGLAAIRGVLGAVGMKLAATPRRALISLLLRRAWLKLRGLGYRERDASAVPPEDLRRIDACWSVSIGLGMVDNFRGADFQTRHLLLALKAGEPYRVARALAMEIAYSAVRGVPARERTAGIARAAMALAERVGNPHAIGLAALTAGTAAILEGRWRDALELCDRGDRVLRDGCAGAGWEIASCRLFSGIALSYLGDFAEASRRAVLLAREHAGSPDLYAVASLRGALHMSLLAADRPDELRRDLDAVMERWSRRDYHTQHYFDMYMRTQADLYSGDDAAAHGRVTEHWPKLVRALFLHNQHIRIVLWQLRARAAIAVAATGRDAAARLAEAARDARSIERERTAWGEALAALVRAGLAAVSGDRSEAAALYGRAAEACDATGMHFNAASARRRRGQVQGGDEGRALVEAADAWMTGQGIRRPERMAAMSTPGFG